MLAAPDRLSQIKNSRLVKWVSGKFNPGSNVQPGGGRKRTKKN